MKLWSQNKKNISYVYLWFIAISEMPVIGRHTKFDHGHLLSVWKASRCPGTLEISQRSGFCTENTENPIELGLLNLLAQYSKIPRP